MTDLGIDVATERLVESATQVNNEAMRNAVAAYLKLVHKIVGRAQTDANAAGDYSLGHQLGGLRGHVGRIQEGWDVDRDRTGGRR